MCASTAAVHFTRSGTKSNKLHTVAFFFRHFLLFTPYRLPRSESAEELVTRAKMQPRQHKSREDFRLSRWPDVSWNVISQTALGMVVFSGIKFQKELPEGNKEEEGKGQQQTTCRFCKVGRAHAADYGSLLGAKKK